MMVKEMIESGGPEGKEGIWKDGKVICEDIDPELPKTWEEFCKLYPVKGGEYYIDSDSIIMLADNGNRLYKHDKNILPSFEAAQAHLAYMQLHQLRDCYRQGWVPDWNNDMTNKYCIEYVENKYSIFNYRITRRFLVFQSKEVAEKFLENFKDLIKQAGDLI